MEVYFVQKIPKQKVPLYYLLVLDLVSIWDGCKFEEIWHFLRFEAKGGVCAWGRSWYLCRKQGICLTIEANICWHEKQGVCWHKEAWSCNICFVIVGATCASLHIYTPNNHGPQNFVLITKSFFSHVLYLVVLLSDCRCLNPFHMLCKKLHFVTCR